MKKGVGFQGAFGVMVFWSLVLTVLKLAGVVGWSWWWVLAPLWVGVLVVVGLLLFALLVLKGRKCAFGWVARLNGRNGCIGRDGCIERVAV